MTLHCYMIFQFDSCMTGMTACFCFQCWRGQFGRYSDRLKTTKMCLSDCFWVTCITHDQDPNFFNVRHVVQACFGDESRINSAKMHQNFDSYLSSMFKIWQVAPSESRKHWLVAPPVAFSPKFITAISISIQTHFFLLSFSQEQIQYLLYIYTHL